MYPMRPKIQKFTGAEFKAFNAHFPLRVPYVFGEFGTDYERKLIEVFLRQIGAEFATSTNLVYFRKESDAVLIQLGMYR